MKSNKQLLGTLIKEEVKNLTENTIPSIVQKGFKESKIVSKDGTYFPKNDDGDGKISTFVKYLENNGFKRVKNKAGDSYAYDYIKGNIIVKYSARFGRGYAAILGVEEN